MWSDREMEVLDNYIKDMLANFNTFSRVPSICNLVKNNDMNNALKFSKNFDMGKMDLRPNSFYGFSRLVQSITWGEFNYIVDQLKNSSNNTQEYKMPDKQVIDSAISKIIGIKPDIMIVPVGFFVHIHKWGMRFDHNRTSHILRYEEHVPYYYYDDETKLRVIWSNNAINLNEIIISKKDKNVWEYKLYPETKQRINFKFEYTSITDFLFYESLFKYCPPKDSEIYCIQYPTLNEIIESEKTARR